MIYYSSAWTGRVSREERIHRCDLRLKAFAKANPELMRSIARAQAAFSLFGISIEDMQRNARKMANSGLSMKDVNNMMRSKCQK